MKNLINISSSNDQQTFIDARSVTGIHVFPDKGEMAIFTEKGLLYALDMKSWKIDADALVQKLADAGNALYAMPMRHDGKEYPHFIAPAAVTFATTTVVSENGTQGIIAGVRGVGWEEHYETTAAEVNGLIDAVAKSGTQLMAFAPEEAHARWSRPGTLYIDPASVREIRDDGSQVNVYFAASGSLDVQTEEYAFPGKRSRDEEHTARIQFAEKIAQANGTLTQLPGTNRAVYVQPEDFTAIRFHTSGNDTSQKFIMMLDRPRTAANPYPEGVRVFFNTAAEREASFKAFVAASQAPAAVKKTKGPQP